MSVRGIVADSKYAQMTPSKTFIGFNNNNLFRVDPRISGSSKMAEGKQYATKNDFSCAVTTGNGEVALASEKGDIRLYNKLGIRAKSHLPAFGDPILGIDTTEDGRYVLATCKTYLLLVRTVSDDGSVSGFTKSLGAKKPAPIRLQLKPEHAAYVGEISFTPAKFNIGSSGPEKFIVTSTGPFVITWNFRRIKQGKVFDYTIKQYQDNVVADQFKFNDNRAIVVALPHDVKVADKTSFVTPKKLYSSARVDRDSIVNSPF